MSGDVLNTENFSGIWIFNLGKSILQSPPPDSSVFIIKHDGPLFILHRTQVINGISNTLNFEMRIEGNETVKDYNGTEITAKMYWQGEELIFDSSFHKGDEKALNIVNYKLASDENALFAEEEFIGKEHYHLNKWVFDRKETDEIFVASEWCPTCQKIQKINISRSSVTETSGNGVDVKITNDNFHCSVCNSFIRSEETEDLVK